MRVLIGCEFSGIVRSAFQRRGHDAWSCDLLPAEDNGPHLQGDIFEALNEQKYQRMGTYQQVPREWDILIFHWPCTHLTRSGALWLYNTPKHPKPGVLYGEARREAMIASAYHFRELLDRGDIERICGENPVPYRDARLIMGEYTQLIHPWEFGHPEEKTTGLWLRGLPKLKMTRDVQAEMMKLPKSQRTRVHFASPGPERWKDRSRTLVGIADAMAEQWGQWEQR